MSVFTEINVQEDGIAVIGLGNIGNAVVRNLLKNNFKDVRGMDLFPKPELEQLGMRSCSNFDDLISSGVKVLITALPKVISWLSHDHLISSHLISSHDHLISWSSYLCSSHDHLIYNHLILYHDHLISWSSYLKSPSSHDHLISHDNLKANTCTQSDGRGRTARKAF